MFFQQLIVIVILDMVGDLRVRRQLLNRCWPFSICYMSLFISLVKIFSLFNGFVVKGQNSISSTYIGSGREIFVLSRWVWDVFWNRAIFLWGYVFFWIFNIVNVFFLSIRIIRGGWVLVLFLILRIIVLRTNRLISRLYLDNFWSWSWTVNWFNDLR